MHEIWKPVPGFSNYLVSNKGRVKRTTASNGTHVGRIRKNSNTHRGYLGLTLYQNGKGKYFEIHRLIALVFLGKAPSSDHEVAHWDGDRTNNKLSNLRWATVKENSNDRRRHGTMLNQKGSKNNHSKLTEKKVIRMRKLREQGMAYKDLAAMFDVHVERVGLICRRVVWRHI